MKPMLSMLALLAVMPSLATAKDQGYATSKSVDNQPAVTQDPAKAYILLRSDDPSSLMLMRIADAADQARYDAARTETLAEEHEKYLGRLKAYERDNKGGTIERPVEPTEANFVYPSFGETATITLGGGGRFAKGSNGYSVYLQEITPGSYRIYGMGPIMQGLGACYCMGSVRFEAKAGEVTDLGTLTGVNALTPVTPEVATDPRLAQWTIRPARYRAVGKLPNFHGVPVTRIMPIAGVLAYDRDRIIDLAATPAE